MKVNASKVSGGGTPSGVLLSIGVAAIVFAIPSLVMAVVDISRAGLLTLFLVLGGLAFAFIWTQAVSICMKRYAEPRGIKLARHFSSTLHYGQGSSVPTVLLKLNRLLVAAAGTVLSLVLNDVSNFGHPFLIDITAYIAYSLAQGKDVTQKRKDAPLTSD